MHVLRPVLSARFTAVTLSRPLLSSPIARSSTMSQPSASSTSTSTSTPQVVRRVAGSNPDSWLERWKIGETGWHKPTPNPSLIKHVHELRCDPVNTKREAGSSPPTIIVPLCGKTLDMVWLYERGWNVIGIELVSQAITEFFQSNWKSFPIYHCEHIDLPATGAAGAGSDQSHASCTPAFIYTAGNEERMHIIQADIFSPHLPALIARCTPVRSPAGHAVDAVWDRAALVALEPAMRASYIHALTSVLRSEGDYLLSVFSYDQSLMAGPPFSVADDAVKTLFDKEGWKNARVLEEEEQPLPPYGKPGNLKMKTWMLRKQ